METIIGRFCQNRVGSFGKLQAVHLNIYVTRADKRYNVSANTLLYKTQKNKKNVNFSNFRFKLIYNLHSWYFTIAKYVYSMNRKNVRKSIVLFNFHMILRTDLWRLSPFSQDDCLQPCDFETFWQNHFLKYSFEIGIILKVILSSSTWKQ